VRLDESASGSASGLQFTGTARLTLDAGLAPTQYDGTYQVAGQNATVKVTLTPTVATVTGIGGGQPDPVVLLPTATHFVVVEPGLLAGLFALPAQMAAWNDAPTTAIAPTRPGGILLAVQAPATPAPHPSGVPANDVAVVFGGRLPFTIWYDPATFVPYEIDVPSENVSATRIR